MEIDIESTLKSAEQALIGGDIITAELLCKNVLQQQPATIRARSVLALARDALGHHDEAAQMFEQLAELQPGRVGHLINWGNALRAARHFDDALHVFMRAARAGCNDANFYYNVGLLHVDRNDFESARQVLAQAFSLTPNDLQIRYHYASVCYQRLQNDTALDVLHDWQECRGGSHDLIAQIAGLLMNLGNAHGARQALDMLPQKADLSTSTRLTLAGIYERTNQLELARAQLARIVPGQKDQKQIADMLCCEARMAQREGNHAKACELLNQVLNNVSEFALRHFQLFDLAKSQDALGQYDAAFATLQEAHQSQVEYLRWSAPDATMRGIPAMTITRHGCDPADIERWRDDNAPGVEDSPVFIVGFPRSGTTLLEQALDAHPLLHSMDEQPFLQHALEGLLAEGACYPENMAQLSALSLQRIRQRYWQAVARRVQLNKGERLLDKNPLNILRLPVIKRVFPNARIILATRHPCDVVLSCYSQQFRAPDFALLCSDLPHLAEGYRRTFDFWYQQQTLLQCAVFEISYERLVSEFENRMKELLLFLNLEWYPQVGAPAEHARSKGYISTPSYSQVVQPVNSRAVGRWRRYEKYLTPLLPMFQPYIDRWAL